MELNYDEIRRIYRLEKNSQQLTALDENFYVELREFLKKEKDAYTKSLKEGSFSEARNFNNLKKLVEEIFYMREKKILNKALIAVRTNDFNDKELAAEEKKSFNDFVKLLLAHNDLLYNLFDEKPRKKEELIQLKMLSEVPAFVGSDLKEYGPFNKDEEITLPLNVAVLLLEKKLAERI
jgi:DNA replication factor GINS